MSGEKPKDEDAARSGHSTMDDQWWKAHEIPNVLGDKWARSGELTKWLHQHKLEAQHLSPAIADLKQIQIAAELLRMDIETLKQPWTTEERKLFLAAKYELEQVREQIAPEELIDFPKIEIAPGFGFLHFLGHFCQKNFRERVLEALHAETVLEYQEALHQKDKVRATITKYMMYIWMVKAVFGGLIGWAFGKVKFKIGGE